MQSTAEALGKCTMAKKTRLGSILNKIEAADLEIRVNQPNVLTSQVQNKSFALLSEDEMALVLAHRAKKLRLQKNIKQKELGKMANLSSATTYSNFEQTGKISLINFLKVLRALGRIPEAEELLKLSLSDTINTYEDETLISKKRVRK